MKEFHFKRISDGNFKLDVLVKKIYNQIPKLRFSTFLPKVLIAL